MIRPVFEPTAHGPMANPLTARPMSGIVIIKKFTSYESWREAKVLLSIERTIFSEFEKKRKKKEKETVNTHICMNKRKGRVNDIFKKIELT